MGIMQGIIQTHGSKLSEYNHNTLITIYVHILLFLLPISWQSRAKVKCNLYPALFLKPFMSDVNIFSIVVACHKSLSHRGKKYGFGAYCTYDIYTAIKYIQGQMGPFHITL